MLYYDGGKHMAQDRYTVSKELRYVHWRGGERPSDVTAKIPAPKDAEIYILSMIDETPSSDAPSLAAAATIAGITSSARLTTMG